MSGTDHSKSEDWAQVPAIVLVRPQMGENIGAAARAMWNFGLDHMRLVAPRDGWPNPAAVAMASGAARVLDHVQVFDSFPEGVGDFTTVYATTARDRDLTKPVMTPEFAMRDAAKRIAGGERVAVLFGPERAGMENTEVARANALITIPVNPAFASLNLAQSVLLLAYEWRRASTEAEGLRDHMAGAVPATQIEVEKLTDRYVDALDARGFFYPPEKAQNMQITLRNMFARLTFTDADIRTLHGIVRAFTRQPKD